MSLIEKTPQPPYYAVIFTSVRTDGDHGYIKMSQKIIELASIQPGYLGFESAREDIGISVSYWTDLQSIKNWKANTEHIEAQKLGHKQWYSNFTVRIAKVEREYAF